MDALTFAGPDSAEKLSAELRHLADLLDTKRAILQRATSESSVAVDEWPLATITITYGLMEFGLSTASKEQ